MALFDRTFLITTGITAVICGAIFYYLNSRLRELELSLAKQNQVLSSFIANVQQEFRGRSMVYSNNTNTNVIDDNDLASPEAIAAVKGLEDKIIISDDEGDSDDSESVSDNDDESASEADDSASEADASDNDEADASENDMTEDKNKLVICDLAILKDLNISLNQDIKIIDLSSQLGDSYSENMIYSSDLSAPEIFTPEPLSDDESDNDESEGNDENDEDEDAYEHITSRHSAIDVEDVNVELKEVKVDEKEVKVEVLDVLSLLQDIISVEKDLKDQSLAEVKKDNEEAKIDTGKTSESLTNLKIDELRKLVVDNNLAKKEVAKTLKKNELLTLLKHTF